MLSVNNITCIRADRLLFENLNLTLKSGDIIQVVGENGSGKSSLLRICAGLLKPTSGEIVCNPLSLFYFGHSLGIKADFTARENILYQLRDINFSEDNLKNALLKWNLISVENQLCRHLSQGQKQRVALATLSLSNAKLWILDEPLSSLDILGMKQCESLFEQHTSQNGSIIFSTHRYIENKKLTIETLEL